MAGGEREGFALLHRKVLDSWLWTLPAVQLRVALTLLLDANWKDRQVFTPNGPVVIPRGSLILGREEYSARFGFTVQTLRTAIKNLKKAKFLTTKSTSRGTQVFITNYDRYQGGQSEANQQTNQRLTSAQPAPNHSEQGNKGTKKISSVVETPDRPTRQSKPKRDPSSYSPEVKSIAWDLAGLIAKNYPTTKIARDRRGNAERWCDAIDKIHRIDGHTFEQIAAVMRWSQSDQFWRQQIKSGATLRKQFDRLIMAKTEAARPKLRAVPAPYVPPSQRPVKIT